ncbi:uncharacterized protein LOC124164329 [Ischnura elegans]|uniref:uncharacterized protein LOC124164329 n=1 Tax=Ischnura elegans TaxID=197161 RepID=UPI001ED884AB|nr:uncharacterized protein LOC124164329 [Ischnura elegans]
MPLTTTIRGVSIFLVIEIIAVSHGQILRLGWCPPLFSSTNPPLELDVLEGTWRLLARLPSLYSYDWKCVTYTFMSIYGKLKYSLTTMGRQSMPFIFRGYAGESGTVTVSGNGGMDTTTVGTYFTFELIKTGRIIRLNYYIVKTDNLNYIVLYACQNFFFGKIDSVLLLAKPETPDADIRAALNSLSAYGITRGDLVYPFTQECIMN